MRPNYHRILTEAVEEGARFGVNRAFKHVDRPDRDAIVESVEREVMNALCERFIFDDHVE